MKIIKYGKGMKLKKGYLTECGCCHTIFMAAPTDVEFLWRNDDPVEFPTPTYRTYCPVCGDTRIYQIKDDKRRKLHINDMLVVTISTVIITLLCEVLPGMTGSTIRILLNALVIILLVVILIAHDD